MTRVILGRGGRFVKRLIAPTAAVVRSSSAWDRRTRPSIARKTIRAQLEKGEATGGRRSDAILHAHRRLFKEVCLGIGAMSLGWSCLCDACRHKRGTRRAAQDGGNAHTGSYSDRCSASKKRRAIERDQVEDVKRTPCRTDSADFRFSCGSTHTTAPSTVAGPLAVCRVSSRRLPGGSSCGRVSKSPDRLIFPVRPSRGVPCPSLPWHMTSSSSGQRIPGWSGTVRSGSPEDRDPP
jgi:hypothetical protein